MSANGPDSKVVGMLVEFDTPRSLLKAAEKVRDAGYTRWDAHTPFPVHGLDQAMGMGKSRVQFLTILCGFAGGCLGLLLQWWMNVADYPYLIGGKPVFSLPANIPVIFETTVLFAAFGTVIGMFALNGLPRFSHPVFLSDRFRRCTSDRFFIAVEAVDPKFDERKTGDLLDSLGGTHVEKLES